MPRPRLTTLHEGSYNMSKDIVERLLLDNMADEVFILQTLKDLDAETREEIRRALDNIAARSRHIGQQLIECVQPVEKVPGAEEKPTHYRDGGV